MIPRLKKVTDDLSKIELERIFWLRLSAFVVITVLAVILKWDDIEIAHTQWIFVSAGLSLSVVWWYWTMRLIRQILQHRRDEVLILHDIVTDIKEIKSEISKLPK